MIYERLGSTRTFILTAILGAVGAFLIYTTGFQVEFYSRSWYLIAVYVFIFGLCTLFMGLIPTTICMNNYSQRHRGLIVGLTGAFWWLGASFFSLIYNKCFKHMDNSVANFFLLLTICVVIANVVSAFLVCPIPSGDTELAELVEPNTESTNDLHELSTANQDSTEAENSETWQEKYGFDLLKQPEFHILSWGFWLVGSTGISYQSNLTIMSASYGVSRVDSWLTVTCPLIAGISKFIIGFASDKTKSCGYDRVIYIIVPSLVQFLLLTISAFHGDAESTFVTTTYVIYVTNALFFVITPTLVSEYFGMKHFARNWGFMFLINALLSFVFLSVFGVLYDQAIEEGTGNDCFGLECTRSFYVVISVFTIFSSVLLIWLCYRGRKR